MAQSADDPLWLRYVDWSATQINKRLLSLSVDELWSIANADARHPVAGDPTVPADLLPSSTTPVELLQLVRIATLSIANELRLPSFAEWKEAYVEDPATYERDILGI